MNKALLLGLVLFAGCGKKDDGGGGGTGKTTEGSGNTPAPSGDVTLNASGATFQKAFQEVAIEGYTKAHKGTKINYGGGGSGKGRQDFADQVVDFACTDAPYKEGSTPPKGGNFFYIPNVLGAITVSYNLDGVKLQLSAETLAKITPVYAKSPEFMKPAIRWIIQRRMKRLALMLYLLLLPLTVPYLGVEGIKVTLRMAWKSLTGRRPAQGIGESAESPPAQAA